MKSPSVRHIAAGAALLAASLASQAAGFSGVYIFGDSLSDSGNNAALIGANAAQVITGDSYIPAQPYALGAYTNATTWATTFTAALGLAASGAPSLAGGGNYAYGGATTLANGSLLGYFPPSATTQLTGAPIAPTFPGGYLYGKASVPSTALYVIAIGGNDARDVAATAAVTRAMGGDPTAAIVASAATYALSVGNMVDALQAKGASRIVVWDVPDLGLTPAALAAPTGYAALSTGVSATFNQALSQRMAGEAGVSIFDIFGITNQIAADPGAYGLTNVTHACGAIAGCNPSTSLFWDGIHPTSAGQALIASAMLTAVPEPSSMLMLAAGIVGLVGLRRRA